MSIVSISGSTRRPKESAAAVEEAIRLYEEKGNIVAARSLRDFLAELPRAGV